MERRLFSYELPSELIAQEPLAERTASRLLVLDGATGRLEDDSFGALGCRLLRGDLLVLNDTRVLPARLYGQKSTGGRVEILLDRLVAARQALVQLRASRGPAAGARISLPGRASIEVLGRDNDLYLVEFDTDAPAYLEAYGQTPLPPYIERQPTRADAERYQTVFARHTGAVAAPTAGLHFDTAMLAALEQRGIELARVTLHVGSGTFAPVRSERIEEHELHAEWLKVDARTAEAVTSARAAGRRVVAVGTTVVRALETAARSGRVEPFEGDTRLFIYPGYEFRVVDAMLTNFHLPESSLLMLVAAFAGYEQVMNAYRHAVAERYRFFSYGDAMFITSGPHARRS